MSMTFDEVKRCIKEGTLGRDVGNDYWIKCDGVATGREQLNFIIDELREQYENKCVFELPAYVLTELKTIKEDNGDDNLQGFMNDVNDNDGIWEYVEKFNSSGMPTDALLGEWWLGHIEFVAKKEPKRYCLKFPSDKSFFAQEDENTWYRTLSIFYAVKFTDEEITEIVDKFPEINSDALEKVKVEE